MIRQESGKKYNIIWSGWQEKFPLVKPLHIISGKYKPVINKYAR